MRHTDRAGRLRGVVSRTDVLGPLTRPDAAIRDDVVEHVLRRTLWIGPSEVQVHLDGGVVRAETTNPQAPRCRKEGSCSSRPSATS
nr:hypothetical protein [uncultured Actinoplanes sp.]